MPTFNIGDAVYAPDPEQRWETEPTMVEGIITGKDKHKLAVNLGRHESDTWVYIASELKKKEE